MAEVKCEVCNGNKEVVDPNTGKKVKCKECKGTGYQEQ